MHHPSHRVVGVNRQNGNLHSMKSLCFYFFVLSVVASAQPRFEKPENARVKQNPGIPSQAGTNAMVHKEAVTRIDLSGKNDVSELSALSSLPNLRELRLNGCNLESLPSVIASFSKLEILDISFNKIASFPDWLASLPNLRELYVSGNPLSSASSLPALKRLQVLALDDCGLTTIPPGVENCDSLRELYASRNAIE